MRLGPNHSWLALQNGKICAIRSGGDYVMIILKKEKIILISGINHQIIFRTILINGIFTKSYVK